MEYVYWIIIGILFVGAFASLVIPILPGVLFLFGGFILYGIFFTFEPFNWIFWTVQGLFVILLFGADYIANIIGVKRYGGSKAGMWGSTIGLIVGPFVIPIVGILIGPFLGAALAELLVNKKNLNDAVKIGFGSVVGFVSSVVTKGIIMAIMLIYFYILI
ncbi:DUF456 domain-containing protein [Mesobacillus subterraneus]|uniref:DUF456 family protein n=1 Tax=Mesobacillus subterraneus TaxID=285983 RepID=A0A427TSR4_9BACI|nr:DUF456 domain-containing protein [Mesobacillus subterraneus]RSD27460.1 DUF456 family protein [Mesobacillus subterraneus]